MSSRLGHISPKTKILFAAILLILTPSAILSYLGLQSIDQKADNLRANYRASIRLMRDKLEGEIVRLEENVHNSLINSPLQARDVQTLKAWLLKLESENPVVKHPFLLTAERGMLSTMLSIGWKQSQHAAVARLGKTDSFQQAEDAEFIRKDIAGAISLYRSALEEIAAPSDRAFILSRLGRCYFKLERYEEGLRAYSDILALPSADIRIGRAPASVVALLQLVDGYEALGNLQKRWETLIKLYDQLVNAPWDLEDGSYLYYLKVIGNAVSEEPSPLVASVEVLKEKENTIFEQAARLHHLQHELVPYILSDLEHSSSLELQLRHASLQSGETKIQFGYFKLPLSFQREGFVALGYEIENNSMRQSIVPEVLQSVDLGPQLAVGIISERDSILFIQETLTASRYLVAEDFGGGLAGWKVALFDRAGKSLDERIAGEKRLYVFLLVGIILVMGLGILVTVRAAVHEMEVARIKADFVANVSHELKTPLALIRMFGETLETGIVSSEEKRKEFYGIIRKESERLTHLINNVLDFSQMDAGSKLYNFEEADVVEVVRSTLEAYKFHIRDLGFQVESRISSEPIITRMDKDAISQALLNLLSNATNYAADRKYICLEVRKNARTARISVTDHGVGIPKKELNKIFDKFYRASTAKTKETRGAGLGLSLVKHIVEAHKGRLEVESVVGQGSTFTIRIPLEPSEGS